MSRPTQQAESWWTRLKTRRSSQAGWMAFLIGVRWNIVEFFGGDTHTPQIICAVWTAVWFILCEIEGRKVKPPW